MFDEDINRSTIFYCIKCGWRITNGEIEHITGSKEEISFCQECGKRLIICNLNSKEINLPSNKYLKPKVRIFVESDILNYIKERFFSLGYSINKISEAIEFDIRDFFYQYKYKYPRFFSLKQFDKFKILVKSELNFDIEYKIFYGKSRKIELKKNILTSEFISIILGDGFLDSKRPRLRITLNGVDEKYYISYIKILMHKLISGVKIIEGWLKDYESVSDNAKTYFLETNNIALHYALIKAGLIPGNKVDNQVSVPKWILESEENMKGSLKGLFDTDGSISVNRVSKSIFLSFENGSKPLVNNFKDMCNLLSIQTGEITKRERFDERFGKISISYIVNIYKKSQVKKFLNIIKPEKLKNNYRRLYLGSWLFYLNKDESFIEIIKNHINETFPNSAERQFSKNFALFLNTLCEEISNERLDIKKCDKIIEDSFIYRIYNYSKLRGEYLKYLYEQLGSIRSMKKFLDEQDIMNFPTRKTISSHLNRYFREEVKSISYKEWLKKYERVIRTNESNKITLISKNLRKLICRFIFRAFEKNSFIYDLDKIFNFLISDFKEKNVLLINWLLSQPDYKIGFTGLIINYIVLINKILIKIRNLEKINSNSIKKQINFPYSVQILREIVELIRKLYYLYKK